MFKNLKEEFFYWALIGTVVLMTVLFCQKVLKADEMSTIVITNGNGFMTCTTYGNITTCM